MTVKAAVPPFDVTVDALVDATIELFEEAGISFDKPTPEEPTQRSPDGDMVVASIIGYAGESMRGALVLVAEANTVRRWQPSLDPNAPLEIVIDKIGEFCNMLLGRLKLRLLVRGARFLFGTPTTAAGNALIVMPPTSKFSGWLRFAGPMGTLHVRLDVTFAPQFEFATRPLSDPPATAGEMLLF